MANDQFGDNQLTNAQKQWKESVYKFTTPIRYFKNNDPYFWEVDNIPIKQLEENVLWLKDQIEAGSDLSGITRRNFAELKPSVDGTSRTVTVGRGNFTARINDAYQKGFQTLVKTADATLNLEGPSDRKYKFNLPTNVLKRIVGDVIGESLYMNGLYEHLQHHDTIPSTSNLSWSAATLGTINDIPKNKLAVWRQGETMNNDISRLNELATAFARRWGGAIRTAVVNVEQDLQIEIPPFSESDYANKTGFSPALRADLLFIYSHPIDAESTTIALPDGDSPTQITKPRLGLLQGAGVVSLKGFNAFAGYDSADPDDEGFFDSTVFTNSLTDNASFFRPDGSISDENHVRTISPISDLNSDLESFPNIFGNFPSPDDVMNLTPLLQEGLENSFALIGQSILPVAYIISRRTKTALTEEDVIDIRPFFRTAELSYNERAGIAAANPPLSFANPAVGKTEFNKALTKSVTTLKSYIDNAVGGVSTGTGGGGTTVASNFITKGAILGGTKFGVEGGVLYFAAENDVDITSDESAITYLQNYHLKGLNALPRYPGWDLAAWCDTLTNPADKGFLRNDRINCAVRATDDDVFQSPDGEGASLAFINSIVDRIANNRYKKDFNPWWNEYSLNNKYDIDTVYYVRKRLKVQLPTDVVDYDVNVNFRNCLPAVSNGKTFSNSLNNYAGIAVEKGSINNNVAEFTIYVGFVPIASSHFVYTLPGQTGPTVEFLHEDQTVSQNYDQRSFFAPPNNKWTAYQRNRDIFSGFTVMNQFYDEDNMHSISPGRANNRHLQNNDNLQSPFKTIRPILVTYPTVEFTVVGHTQLLSDNYIFNTSTPNGQPTLS